MSEISIKGRSYDKNPGLIIAYRGGDKEAGEELVKLNLPLVYNIAARFSSRVGDTSDLVECGHIGLVKAINTFDTERGCAFSTYAVPLIFGEMRRFLRDDGAVKVSREERRLCALLTRERERRQSLGEPCDIGSLAKAIGISVQDAASAIFAELPVRSLDECVYEDDDSVTLGTTIFDEDEEVRHFDHLSLRYAVERLPEMEKKIILLRYFKDLSQSETAKILGLSQVKVSREEKKIMARLKKELS
jgi:RNA polymerase sporulation-specific sigma factor